MAELRKKSRNELRLLLLLASVLAVSAAHGHNLDRKFGKKFEHMSVDAGLPHNNVSAMLQDSRGFMWFGTENGLSRFDGYDHLIFRHDPDDSTSLDASFITSLIEDQFGNFWVGTSKGLNRLHRSTSHFERFPEILVPGEAAPVSVHGILADTHETIWVCTSRGIRILNLISGSLKQYRSSPTDINTLPDDFCRAILKDRNGAIWVGTSNGVAVFDSAMQKFMRVPQFSTGRAKAIIRAIKQAPNGDIWVATAGDGAFQRLANENSVTHFAFKPGEASIAGNLVYDIAFGDEGVWLATNKGLSLFPNDDSGVINYSHEGADIYSLSSSDVTGSLIDRAGRLWVATRFGGVNVFDKNRQKFAHYASSQGIQHTLTHDKVTSFTEDAEGNIWIGTDGGGINVFDPEDDSFSKPVAENGSAINLTTTEILSLIFDRHGDLWAGTRSGGLNRVNKKTGRVRNYRTDGRKMVTVSDNKIVDLYEDKAGIIWIGTARGGLNSYNRKTDSFTRYKHSTQSETGVSGQGVVHMIEDRKGRLWIATEEAGLNMLDESRRKFAHYNHEPNSPETISSDQVTSLCQDAKGRIWVGTRNGLNLFDGNATFHHFHRKQGLPSDLIVGILEDQEGRIWCSTSNGLARVEITSDPGEPFEVTFQDFTVSEGLQSKQFARLAFFKTQGGDLYFGGVNGFNVFDPKEITNNGCVPAIVITGFELFDRPVAINTGNSPLNKPIWDTKKISLSHDQSVFSFEFAALDYTAPSENKYAYKMEGFDSDWRYTDADKRFATYTNLDAGHYTFRVKGSNSDGVWNEQGATLAITIRPPWWGTLWFKLLVIATVSWVFRTGFRVVQRQMAAEQERILAEHERKMRAEKAPIEREQAVERREAELMERARSLLNQVMDGNPNAIQILQGADMSETSTEVLHNIGNLVNSVTASAKIMNSELQKMNLAGLGQVNDLFRKHIDNIPDFMANNPQGVKLVNNLLNIETQLRKQHETISENAICLQQKVRVAQDLIAAQQDFAHSRHITEPVRLSEIVEQALLLHAPSFVNSGIKIEKHFEEVSTVNAHATHLLQILTNLFRNAKESIHALGGHEKRIRIAISHDDDDVFLKITDSGKGLSADELEKLFTFGRSTRSEGHGFGLGSCARYMSEMNGGIRAESDGPGKGATFILNFPKNAVQKEVTQVDEMTEFQHK